MSLNSNGNKFLQQAFEKAAQEDEEDWEALKSLCMMTFLCIQSYSQMDVTMQNFKLLLNLHFAIETNSFGISNSEMLRVGTALYFPTNFINHSCDPNAFIKFSGKK
jgi:hypothetical protein